MRAWMLARLMLPAAFRARQRPGRAWNARFRTSGQSNAETGRAPIKSEVAFPESIPRPWSAHGNHEKANKSKGPDKSPGLW